MNFDSEKIFGPQGLLAAALPTYEYRREQIEMAARVHSILKDGGHGIIEAGTGVGKSLAYLLPAICYTKQEDKRIVVATHTIALQEQLFYKDIPFLQEILPQDFTAEVFKGRTNYLCLRRWHELKGPGKRQFLPLNGELQTLEEWVKTTETGDQSEIPTRISHDLWVELRCEKESCPEELCPYFSECYYWGLRHRLAQAQLIVTNQAMLLADARAEGRILPEYDGAVIDEAHNLDDVATNSFSHRISRRDFLTCYRIGTQLQTALRDAVPEYIIQDLHLILEQLIKEAAQYFTQIEQLITAYTVPLTQGNRLQFSQTSLAKHLKDVQKVLEECSLEEDEVFGLKERFAEYTEQLWSTLNLILKAEDEDYVFWAEMQNGEAFLVAAPIRIDTALRGSLFEKIPAVILTSATLSTDQSFEYIRSQLGITEASELILGSPFAYEQQALLCVPAQAKNPNHPRYAHYATYLILHTAAGTRGGVLVLFTSYRLMDEIARMITPKLDEVGYTLFKQGDGSRLGLIRSFQEEPRSLLFGTNSFWEGIDLPRAALKAVVITRLPFTVPNRPVTAARLRAIEEAGGNSFLEYSVPQAILRLKQGFGRLIRTRQDLGGVIILDERILTGSYGPQFLRSLPPARFTRDLAELAQLFKSQAEVPPKQKD